MEHRAETGDGKGLLNKTAGKRSGEAGFPEVVHQRPRTKAKGVDGTPGERYRDCSESFSALSAAGYVVRIDFLLIKSIPIFFFLKE